MCQDSSRGRGSCARSLQGRGSCARTLPGHRDLCQCSPRGRESCAGAPGEEGSCASAPPWAEGAVLGLRGAEEAVLGLCGAEGAVLGLHGPWELCCDPQGKRMRWQQGSPGSSLHRTLQCHQLPPHCLSGLLSAFPGSPTCCHIPWVPTMGVSSPSLIGKESNWDV